MIAIRSRQGFTLIEMLVVIAIIGILSSLFLVGFQGYRNSATDAATIAAIHKAQLALEQCYNENGNYTGPCDAYTQIVSQIPNSCGTVQDQTYVIGAQLLGKNAAAANDAAGQSCGQYTCGNTGTQAVFCLSSSGR
jgi:prepilin-type N-terminal cleavage/methylation domain-containing protein